MKTVLRIILVFCAFVSSYFFTFWVPLSLIPGAHSTGILPNIISILVAVAVSVFLWKKTGSFSNSLASSILVGGIILGATGFVLGFFGPLVFSPDSNQGPLLGILYTGPLGFVLGLILGGLYWMIKAKKRSQVQDTGRQG